MSDSILSLESAKIRNYIIPIFLDKKAHEFRVEYFSSIGIDREKSNFFTCLQDMSSSLIYFPGLEMNDTSIYIFHFWTQ